MRPLRPLAAGWLLCIFLAWGQITTSSFTGFVSDPTGAAVPGAQVTIKEMRTGFTRSVATNELGQYTLTGIPAGTYTITVEKAGFQTTTRSEQVLGQQASVRVDFALSVGDTQQVVTVEATAPLLQTEDASLAVTMQERQIVNLPALGRSYLSTAILSPGVAPTVGNSILNVVFGQQQTGGSAFKPVSVNISGGPPEFTAFIEDGFDVRDPIYGGNLYQPSVEAMSSYRVVRGYDSAQYGGEPSIIYTTSKSGTNQYHGSVFWFHQNRYFNARTAGAASVPPLVYNQGGFTVGGPVLPQLRDKTFFFFSHQLTRMRSGTNLFAIVPTAEQWAGDLSAIPQPIYNPFEIDPVTNTRQPFPGNRIPQSLLSPFAQRYKEFVPLPTNPGAPSGQFNLTRFGRQINDDTQYLIRIDHMLPRAGKLFAKYFHDDVGAFSFGLSAFAGFAQPLLGQTASVEWAQPIGARMVNQFRVGFFRSETNFGAVPTREDIAGEVLGLRNVSRDPTFFGLPAIGVTGISVPGTALFNLFRVTTRVGLNENFTWITGRHSLDFGFLFQPTQWPQKNGIFPRGQINYDGAFTRQAPGGPGGAGLADFLLGTFTSAAGNPTGFSPLLDTRYWAWHAQDQIKATRKLTVTLGVRWDYWEPPRERYNRWVAFDQNRGELVFALKDPLRFQEDFRTLSGDIPRGLFKNWNKTNFSPRLSLAYLLTPNTTIRSAYGMYYAQGMANFQIFSSLGFGGPPFTNNTNVTNDVARLTPQRRDTELFPPPAIGQITPGTLFVTQDIYAPQSYVHQATFSVERQLTANILVSAGYNGFFGRHLMASYNINQAELLDPTNPRPLQERRPYPFFSDILLQSNSGTSSYNGMYLHFRKSFSHGFDIIASYTWSKALDLFSSDSGGWQNQDARNTRLDRGLADFDVRHYFTAGYLWDLPFGPNRSFVQSGVASAILRDWRFSGITQFRSGLPFTPSMPTSWPNVAAVFTRARPNRVCDGRLDNPTMDRFFDTDCFVRPPANRFGNSGRNVLIGPGAQFWDMSLARTFPIREAVRMDFRAEVYSVFNHQNWNSPDAGVVNPNFGRIFGKNYPRRFQFGVRVEF